MFGCECKNDFFAPGGKITFTLGEVVRECQKCGKTRKTEMSDLAVMRFLAASKKRRKKRNKLFNGVIKSFTVEV